MHFKQVVLGQAYRSLTGGFLLLQNFQCWYFCESLCLFYYGVNFDFYVSFLR